MINKYAPCCCEYLHTRLDGVVFYVGIGKTKDRASRLEYCELKKVKNLG